MVWDPARIVPRPWESVVELYRHLAERNEDFGPLLRLVEHAISQAYASSILSATSGTALLVTREPTNDWAAEALHIDVDLSGSVRFTLPARRLAKPMSFECEGEKIVDAFERYVRGQGD